jgi:hypothetical protein
MRFTILVDVRGNLAGDTALVGSDPSGTTVAVSSFAGWSHRESRHAYLREREQ